MKTIGFLCVTLLLIGLPACKGGGPSQSAQDAADQISAHLDANQLSEADDVYRSVKKSEQHREVIYATLYKRASELYDESDFASAARMLEFLEEHYPKSVAVKEALLWSLLLSLRGGSAEPPDDERLDEMKELVDSLRREKIDSAALDIVMTQVEIDRGRLDAARKHLASFKSKWDGNPAELHAYITELDRYLMSHVGGEG